VEEFESDFWRAVRTGTGGRSEQVSPAQPTTPVLPIADESAFRRMGGDKLREVCAINPPKPAADALPSDARVTFVQCPLLTPTEGQLRSVDPTFGRVRRGLARPFRMTM